MSKEKIREILSDFWCERITIDTALTEINKIVMECLPKEADAETSPFSNRNLKFSDGVNQAIAEFKANWEGK